MKYTYCLHLLIIFLFTSCTSDRDQVDSTISFSTDGLFTLKINNNQLIDRPRSGTFSHVIQIDGQDNLILYRKKSGLIQKINLKTGSIQLLELPKDGPFAVTTLTNTYWKNDENIYVWSLDKFMRLNSAGEILESKRFNPLGQDIPEFMEKEVNPILKFGAFVVQEGEMYLPLRHQRYDQFTFPDYYTGPLIGKLNLNLNEWTPTKIEYPTNHTSYYGFLSRPFFEFKSDHIWTGFGYTPNLYRYDKQSKKYSELTLSGLAGFPDPMPYSGATGDPGEMIAHSSSNVNYTYILTDQKNNIIYRLATYPGERPSQIKPVVLAYNFDGDKIMEHFLPSYHSFDGAFIRNGKLHIPYTKGENENEISYRLIHP